MGTPCRRAKGRTLDHARGVTLSNKRRNEAATEKMKKSVDKTAQPFVAHTGLDRFAIFGALRLPG